MSLFQKGPNGEERTEVEHTVFKKSLSNMMEWYAHPKVFTFKLTRLPRATRPASNSHRAWSPTWRTTKIGANLRCLLTLTLPSTHTQDAVSVLCRGWCFCESSVSNLIKSFVLVLDLGKFDEESMTDWSAVNKAAGRIVTLADSLEFRPELATKSFTSKNADEEMVNRLFEDEFNKRMGGVTELKYAWLEWTDKEAVAVSKVIATGVLKKLERLLPRQQPDWRCRRDGARGGGEEGHAAAAQGTRLAADWRCRRDGAAARRRAWRWRRRRCRTSSTSPRRQQHHLPKPRTPSRPPCPTVM